MVSSGEKTEKEDCREAVPTGKQTQITEIVLKISEDIESNKTDYLNAVNSHIRDMRVVESNRFEARRTAGEILESGWYSGCQEAGLARIALIRARGTHATYVQALDLESVKEFGKNPSELHLKGHVFIKTTVNNHEVFINSTTGEVTDTLPDGYIVGAEGLDSWDIGLRDQNDMKRLYETKRAEINSSPTTL